MKHLIYIVHGFILLLYNVMAVMAFLFMFAFAVAHSLFIVVPIYFYFTGHTILSSISVTITLLFVFWTIGSTGSTKDKKNKFYDNILSFNWHLDYIDKFYEFTIRKLGIKSDVNKKSKSHE